MPCIQPSISIPSPYIQAPIPNYFQNMLDNQSLALQRLEFNVKKQIQDTQDLIASTTITTVNNNPVYNTSPTTPPSQMMIDNPLATIPEDDEEFKQEPIITYPSSSLFTNDEFEEEDLPSEIPSQPTSPKKESPQKVKTDFEKLDLRFLRSYSKMSNQMKTKYREELINWLNTNFPDNNIRLRGEKANRAISNILDDIKNQLL
jgi:hypothetical protein